MKCPKYISAMIDRRATLASQLTVVDIELCNWLDKHGILDELETYDTHGGCEMYSNPWASAQRIRKAIELKGAEQQ